MGIEVWIDPTLSALLKLIATGTAAVMLCFGAAFFWGLAWQSGELKELLRDAADGVRLLLQKLLERLQPGRHRH